MNTPVHIENHTLLESKTLSLTPTNHEALACSQHSGLENLRIFIGYDSKEPIATYVCMHSLQKFATKIIPISILRLDKLQSVLNREKTATQSTEFAFSRFLVPYLSNFQGFSLFVDSDFIFRADIGELLKQTDPTKAVSVVKHDYEPRTEKKFLDQKQTKYERKNWSSLILFNNAKCKALSPKIVSESSGLYLHRFRWLSDDDIGEIDLSWNYLVGEYSNTSSRSINALHYTIGGPYFEEYKNCDFADQWIREFQEMKAPLNADHSF